MAAEKYDAIIIGAGHNGLVTAAYLARAGKRVLVLERRPVIGGILATEEVFPGFKYLTVAHDAGAFAPEIIAELQLAQHGVQFIEPTSLLLSLSPGASPLIIPRDMSRFHLGSDSAAAADAPKLESFGRFMRRMDGFLSELYKLPLPDGARPDDLSLVELAKIGVKFRRLGEKDMYEFLRLLPMSLADLLDEWFESDALKAAIAGTTMLGSFVGPRQQGTVFSFLHHQLGESNGAFRTKAMIKGGINRLAHAIALAAERSGTHIRTGAEVQAINTENGIATGVTLTNGSSFSAQAIISSADCKQTLLELVEPTYLDPLFLLQIKNIRSRGTLAKANFALDRLPKFTGLSDEPNSLGGIMQLAPSVEYLERAADDAKYGRISPQPYLQLFIPTLLDPDLAPTGKHVMSVWAQSVPFHLRDGDWSKQRETLGDHIADKIETLAPGFKQSVLHRQTLTPLDLAESYRLPEGHIFHAELALDQIFFMRPVPGWARYSTPIKNLYLCGSSSHPGGTVTGLPGRYAAQAILKHWPER